MDLITYDHIKGQFKFYGDYQLKSFIEQTESIYGILGYELQRRVYDEYVLHKSVYDLLHNKPDLLMFQVPRLIHQCKIRTKPTDREWLSMVNKYCRQGCLNPKLYPVLPEYLFQMLNEYLNKIIHYMDFETSEQRTEFREQFEVSRKRYFYSHWYELLHSKKAVNKFMESTFDMLTEHVPEDKITLVTNVTARHNGQLKEELEEKELVKTNKSSFLKKLFS